MAFSQPKLFHPSTSGKPCRAARRTSRIVKSVAQLDEVGPLQRTFQVLAATANDCAESTLIGALDSRSAEIVAAAAKAILIRQGSKGQDALLDHWGALGEFFKPICLQFPGRLVKTLAKRLEGDDWQRARQALKIAIEIEEFDFIPHLLPLVENRRSPLRKDAEDALVALSRLLYDETHGHRSYVKRRDPQLVRSRVLNALEACIGRFEKHQASAVLVSFLMLAGKDHVQLARMSTIDGSGGPAQQEMFALLRKSDEPGVMRLLASFLDDHNPPLAALQIVAQRVDNPFIDECLTRIDRADRQVLAKNCSRIEDWQWLNMSEKAWAGLYEREQTAAVTWAMSSGASREHKLSALRWFLQFGRQSARLRAAEALSSFPGEDANALVLGHLSDSNPLVRAELLSQLRPREIQGAMTRLLKALDDPDPQVRSAIQKQLPEFRFRRYADLFDAMQPEVQSANGRIVKAVDPLWRGQLEAELQSETRLRKLRGLRMAQCMNAGDEVVKAVLPFTTDDDALTRQEAIRVLGASRSPEAIEAIRQALLDPQPSVRRAAEEVMQRALIGGVNGPGKGVAPFAAATN